MFRIFYKDKTFSILASILEYYTFESNSNNNNNNNNRRIYVILIAWTLLKLVKVELNIRFLITFWVSY
jgi:hypothetical protein